MRWIIGDIHGMLRPLDALLRFVARRDSKPRFFFAGDFVNRGPDSRGVVDLLLALPDATFARGNHDDIFDLLLNGKSLAAGHDPSAAFAWFMEHGLDKTLLSYGVSSTVIDRAARRPTFAKVWSLAEAVPQNHRDFFAGLQPFINSEPDIFIVHASWNPEDDDAALSRLLVMPDGAIAHRLLWDRFSDFDLAENKAWRRRGFFGHTPVMNYSGIGENLPIVRMAACCWIPPPC